MYGAIFVWSLLCNTKEAKEYNLTHRTISLFMSKIMWPGFIVDVQLPQLFALIQLRFPKYFIADYNLFINIYICSATRVILELISWICPFIYILSMDMQVRKGQHIAAIVH